MAELLGKQRARLEAGAGAAGSAAVEGDGLGAEVRLMAGLSAGLGQLARSVDLQRGRAEKIAQAIRPVGGTAGPFTTTLDLPDLLGPRQGYVWDIRRIAVAGFTGGSIAVYEGLPDTADQSNEIVSFTTPGTFWVPSNSLMLTAGARLVAIGSSVTGGAVLTWRGISVESWLIGEYLI